MAQPTDAVDVGPLGRRFWNLWSAFGASNLADGLSFVAFPLLAISLTDDARLVAVVAAARFLPFLVVSLPAGVLIDRLDRRRIAMVGQIVRAAALFLLIATIAFDSATILLASLIAFVVGVAEVLIDGGLPAIVRDLVTTSQLETANSRLRATETVTNAFIGPPLGAFAFQIDPVVPFALAGGLYVLSAGLLIRVPGSFTPAQEADRPRFVTQVGDGLRYVWGHDILRPLALAVAAFSFVGSATNAVLVILATERLGLSEVQYGFLLTADAVASFTMAFLVTRLVRRTSHGMSMRLAVTTFTIHAVLLGTFTMIPVVIFAILLNGVSDPSWNVISATVRQRLVDDRIFGRMMTAYLFLSWSLNPVGAVVGGIIAERWGSEYVYLMAGCVVGSLLLFAHPLFGRIDRALAARE